MAELLKIVYGLSIPLIILFGALALLYAYQEKKSKKDLEETTAEEFLTAKNTQPFWRVTYSFVSTSLGAWVLFGPPSYCIFAGLFGMVLYSLSSCITILIPAYFGPSIQNLTQATSLTEFVSIRYGKFAKFYITFLCLYSMGIGLTAEYTAIGDVFELVVGGSRIMIVVLIGIITSIYTAIGGLSVSVKTDQVQSLFVLVMFLIFTIYISSTVSINKPFPNDDRIFNYLGYSSIASMPLGLSGSVIFSEAFWQKAYIAKDLKTLRKASLCACGIIFIVVFTFGFFGFMAIWNENVIVDQNLILFSWFPGNHPQWIIVLIVLVACIMNESAVDSYQLGIVCSVFNCFFKNYGIWVTRILVLILNIPIIVLSLEDLGVINLFLSANLMATSSMVPVLLGLNKKIHNYYFTSNLVVGSMGGLIFPALWGISKENSFKKGMKLVFYLEYRWETFFIAFVSSTLLSLGLCGIYYLKNRNKPTGGMEMRNQKQLF